MSSQLAKLRLCRGNLNEVLDQWDPTWVRDNWPQVQGRVQALVDSWWSAFKEWEAWDTFDDAFQDDRMTVRSFSPDFAYEVAKQIPRGTIGIAADRFYEDSQYAPLDASDQAIHHASFNQAAELQKYYAKRGIDSSAFANPANFATREKKYETGLHDLSASLLNHKHPILDQVHHKTDDGAHFSFLPLSEEADQEVIYNLTGFAKTIPQLYQKVRGFRAEMTRLKLADPVDAGTGMTAVPAPRPGTGPQYKLRYGSKTADGYSARKKAALKFKGILRPKAGKNEVVISIRKHAGHFPVYAVRNGTQFKCYNIVSERMMLNGDVISPDGHMTHIYMKETGAAGLPVREPARILAYMVPNSANVRVLPTPLPGLTGTKAAPPPPPPKGAQAILPTDPTFRSRFETAVNELGEIPKRSGLRVFVIAPKYDEIFRRVLADVENQVHDLNRKGFRLSLASLPNRSEIRQLEVRLYYV